MTCWMSDKYETLFITHSSFRNPDNDECAFGYRFADPLTEADVQKILETCEPKSTKYKTDWAKGDWWQEERRQRSLEDNIAISLSVLKDDLLETDSEDLNTAMKYFVFEARRVDGTSYPAITVYGLFTAIASALKLNGSPFNLMDDEEFNESSKGLDACMRERCASGLGADCRKPTEVIARAEENTLWEKGALGEDNPQQLLDTTLYLTGLNFALRGGKEHRSPRLHQNPQITAPHTDQNGRRYLQYTGDASKSNPGGIKHRKMQKKKVRAYENIEHPKMLPSTV